MREKRIYLGLGVLAVVGVAVVALLVFKANRLSLAPSPGPAVERTAPVTTETKEASPAAVLADLILDFGDGAEKDSSLTGGVATFSAVRSEKGTALDLLLAAAEKEGLAVDYEEQEFGAFIKSIGGVENAKDAFWLFYINGRMAPVAADKQKIENGDRVEFRYERMKTE